MLVVIVITLIIIVVGVAAYFTLLRPSRVGGDLDALVRSLIGDVPKELTVRSNAFRVGEAIPIKYTCDGTDTSPPLSWSGYPEAKYYAVIMVDPDAPRGVFIHWILYNIPTSINSLNEGIAKKGVVEGLGLQSKNHFGKVGYGGPCPPKGEVHRYVVIVVALKDEVKKPPASSPEDILNEIRRLALAYGYTYGVYGR